ncbi:DUF4148 domain-containing protein [Burkholderia cenocepacia]|nr:DUF4148 domain-containing protein [Burkholderia cenocepacia]
MKTTQFFAALGFALLSFSAHSADIGSPPSEQQTAASGKTREQVRAELVQAQKDGWLPVNKIDYPPSEAQIERNRQLYEERNRPSSGQ